MDRSRSPQVSIQVIYFLFFLDKFLVFILAILIRYLVFYENITL